MVLRSFLNCAISCVSSSFVQGVFPSNLGSMTEQVAEMSSFVAVLCSAKLHVFLCAVNFVHRKWPHNLNKVSS